MKSLNEFCKKFFNTHTYEVKAVALKKPKMKDDCIIIPINNHYSLCVYGSNIDRARLNKLFESEDLQQQLSQIFVQQRENFLKAVLNISVYLNMIREFDELLNNILKEVESLMNAEASSIFIAGDKPGYLQFFTLRGATAELKEVEVPIENSFAGAVFKERQIKIDNALQESKQYFTKADEISKLQTRSMLAAPLIIRNKCIGVIEVINKKEESGGRFDDFDKEMIKIFAAQAAVALENALLNKEMNEFFFGLIRALSESIEAKDKYTRGHTERVARISLLIGQRLGLDKRALRTLELSAILHDIGKIGIPESILNKPGKLTADEYMKIKEHPVIGAQILQHIKKFKEIREGVLYHHESYDGYGYPAGLSGENIPIAARIIAVADTYDTLITERPYKKALTKKEAVDEIKRCRGTQFDPKVVDAFVKVIERM